MLGLEGELLASTENIVGQWKEHFQDLLNLANMSSIEEAESKNLGKDSPITLAEVARVVKKLPSCKVPGEDEIRPEMLKAVDMVGLS